MDSTDFYDGLHDEEERFEDQVAAAEHLLRLKIQTGLADKQELEKEANAVTDSLKSQLPNIEPGMLMAMGLGAGAGSLLTYRGSKPREELSGKSKDEVGYDTAVEASKLRPEEGLLQKLRNRGLEHRQGIAKAFREHPGKATAVGGAVGAGAGYGLGKLLKFVAEKAKSGAK